MRINIQHTKWQMHGSSWHIVTSRQDDETIVQSYQQFMETVDQTEQIFGTIVPLVMMDAYKSSVKIDENQKKEKK
jgi:hypothetical protein